MRGLLVALARRRPSLILVIVGWMDAPYAVAVVGIVTPIIGLHGDDRVGSRKDQR